MRDWRPYVMLLVRLYANTRGVSTLDHQANDRDFEAPTLRWKAGGSVGIRAMSRPMFDDGPGSTIPSSIGSQTQWRSSPSDADIQIHEVPDSLSSNRGG